MPEKSAPSLSGATPQFLWFLVVISILVPASLLGLTFKVLGELAWPEWLVWTARILTAVLALGFFLFLTRPVVQELWSRRGKAHDSGPSPAPQPATEEERSTVTGLWVGILVVPAFGGLFLAVPLVGTPVVGSWWGTLGFDVLIGGFFTVAGVLVGVPRLAELVRRGAWAPPGTARRPVRVAIALTVLSMAAAVAAVLTLIAVVQLVSPAS